MVISEYIVRVDESHSLAVSTAKVPSNGIYVYLVYKEVSQQSCVWYNVNLGHEMATFQL